MTRDELCPGLPIHLRTPLHWVPAGTYARVENVGLLRDGRWYFTVRYVGLPVGQTVNGRKVREGSTHSVYLFATDLELSELVMEKELEENKLPVYTKKRGRRTSIWGMNKPNQRSAPTNLSA